MQKEDSYYTDSFIVQQGGDEAFQNACSNPPEALSQHLQAVAPQPRETSIQRTFDVSSVSEFYELFIASMAQNNR